MNFAYESTLLSVILKILSSVEFNAYCLPCPSYLDFVWGKYFQNQCANTNRVV